MSNVSRKIRSLSLSINKEKKKELEEFVDGVERDNEGQIPKEAIQKLFESANVPAPDINGPISPEDFTKMARTAFSEPFRMSTKQSELWEAFQAFDKDGDGVINPKELACMMTQLGDPITERDAKGLIADVDKNLDGSVDFDEFCVMMGVEPPNKKQQKRISERFHDHHQDNQTHQDKANGEASGISNPSHSQTPASGRQRRATVSHWFSKHKPHLSFLSKKTSLKTPSKP